MLWMAWGLIGIELVSLYQRSLMRLRRSFSALRRSWTNMELDMGGSPGVGAVRVGRTALSVGGLWLCV